MMEPFALKKVMKKVLLIAFILVSTGELVAILTGTESMHQVFKPLIMIALALYYWFSTGTGNRSALVLLAIFFSFAGDTVLLFEERSTLYFMLGLASFLLAHLFYIFAYRQHRNDNAHTELQGVQRARVAFPIILAISGLVVILYPVLGALRIPVIVYALVIVVMVLSALFRYGRTTSPSFWMVFSGALLFMVSDSLLAINKFLQPLAYASFGIMATYCVAQFLIVRGLVSHR
jgi:uncharacterized membrane protein YhhN